MIALIPASTASTQASAEIKFPEIPSGNFLTAGAESPKYGIKHSKEEGPYERPSIVKQATLKSCSQDPYRNGYANSPPQAAFDRQQKTVRIQKHMSTINKNVSLKLL